MAEISDFPPSGKGGARPGAGRPKGTGHRQQADAGNTAPMKAAALMANARAKKEMYLANLAEIEYQQKRGELIRIETVFRVIDAATTACREYLTGLPGRWASILAAETDEREIERLMDQEIRQALQQLVDAKRADFSPRGE